MQTLSTQRTIPCAACGDLFAPGSIHSLYCSLTCKERAKRHRRAHRHPTRPSLQKKLGPYYAILISPTLKELQVVCEEFMLRADPAQGIYVENKPPGFTLPPGLRDNEYDNIYKIAFT